MSRNFDYLCGMKERVLHIQQIQEQYLREILHFEQDLLLIDNTNYQGFIYNQVVLNNYVVMLMLQQGSIRVRVNGVQEHIAKAQGVLYHLPENMFQIIEISDDFQAKCLVMSKDFVSRLGVVNSLDLSLQLLRNPFLSLGREALEALLQCYQMLENLLQHSAKNPHLPKILQHLLQAYMLTFSYHLHEDKSKHTPATSEESVTYKFLALLKEYGTKEHSVTFYADRMCLTPKYLSRCMKAATGMAAKPCIDKYLIAYAQNMLASSEMSLTELAYALGFNDPSNFNKFFRTHTGISPKEYRLRAAGSNSVC